MPVGWVNKVGSSPTFLAIFQNRIVEFRGNPAPGEPSTRGNPAPGFVLDLILMVSFGFFTPARLDSQAEMMFPWKRWTQRVPGSHMPPRNRGISLGTKNFEKLGKLCDGKHPKRKKKNPMARKKTYLAGVHLLVYRGCICRHSDWGGWKKNGRLEGTCGLVRLLLVKTG